MRIRMRDGRELMGTPTQIVSQMKGLAFGGDEQTVSEYIDKCCGDAMRFFGADVKATGDSDETKAASFVNAMIDAGLADRLA